MQRIVIIGATSAIAIATARRYATRGAALHLIGRQQSRLDDIAADLSTRGAKVTTGLLDVSEIQAHKAALDVAWTLLGGADTVLIAHGTLASQAESDASVSETLHQFSVNGTSTIALSQQVARRLAPGGTLAVISSVAGDRGRASNYLYGSAKAAVTTYLSGLGQKLRADRINVLTIKPGFVDTPMTADFKKGPLWATPESIASGIVKAIDRRRPVVYLPGFWWGIMLIIKSIPEFVFRRIKL